MARRDWYCEDVLSGNLEVTRVFEDDRVLAFHHPRPVAEVHVVVVPKEHIASLLDVKALDGDLLSSIESEYCIETMYHPRTTAWNRRAKRAWLTQGSRPSSVKH